MKCKFGTLFVNSIIGGVLSMTGFIRKQLFRDLEN